MIQKLRVVTYSHTDHRGTGQHAKNVAKARMLLRQQHPGVAIDAYEGYWSQPFKEIIYSIQPEMVFYDDAQISDSTRYTTEISYELPEAPTPLTPEEFQLLRFLVGQQVFLLNAMDEYVQDGDEGSLAISTRRNEMNALITKLTEIEKTQT